MIFTELYHYLSDNVAVDKCVTGYCFLVDFAKLQQNFLLLTLDLVAITIHQI
jgi:hypothetical protein